MPELIPLTDAVESISARTPIGSVLRTREWADVPLALRQRAQFSAGVESVRVLQAIQDRLEQQLKQQREKLDSGEGATFDRSSFIDAIRQIAREEGLTPVKEELRGGLQDITSIRRLGLIYDVQNQMAQGHARWKLDQTEGALLLFPAQEFVRVEERQAPRDDWPKRFAEAAQAAGDDAALQVLSSTGRMVALKTSGLWAKLSRFGVPWPPFDFGSGMGLEDVDRDDAVALGLLGPDQRLQPAGKDFNEELKASTEGLSPEMLAQLKKSFGDQIGIAGDRVEWKGDGAEPETPPTSPPTPVVEKPADPIPNSSAIMAERSTAGGWSEDAAQSIRRLPPELAANLESATFEANPTHSGYYRRSTRTIVIHPDPTQWSGGPLCAAHEVGHHIHYELGIVSRQSVDPDFASAIAADLKGFESWMKERRGSGWRTQVSAAKTATRFALLHDIEAAYGVEDATARGDLPTKYRLGRFADTISGLSGARYGYGHTRAYMKDGNHSPMEVFANAFSALFGEAEPDPVYTKAFPNVVAFMREKLKVKV